MPHEHPEDEAPDADFDDREKLDRDHVPSGSERRKYHAFLIASSAASSDSLSE